MIWDFDSSWSFSNFFLTSSMCCLSLWISSCEMPSTRRSISEDCIDLFFQLAPVSRTTCHPPEDCGCCWCSLCCCCESHVFLRVWSGLWCQNSLEYDSTSVIANNSLSALMWHWLMYNDRIWFCLPKLQSKILCSWQFYPEHSVLVTSPMTFIRNFSGFRIIITWLLSFMCITSEWIKEREENNWSSFFTLLSSCHETFSCDKTLTTRRTCGR